MQDRRFPQKGKKPRQQMPPNGCFKRNSLNFILKFRAIDTDTLSSIDEE
jgi:hypothetical protein